MSEKEIVEKIELNFHDIREYNPEQDEDVLVSNGFSYYIATWDFSKFMWKIRIADFETNISPHEFRYWAYIDLLSDNLGKIFDSITHYKK